LRAAAVGLGLAATLAIASTAAAGPPPAQRQTQLLHLLKHDCGSCHGLTLRGGLGPPLLPAELDGKAEETLIQIILYGSPGTPMPAWSPLLDADEAKWLVRKLKEGAVR
jgi:cytochrome c55X